MMRYFSQVMCFALFLAFAPLSAYAEHNANPISVIPVKTTEALHAFVREHGLDFDGQPAYTFQMKGIGTCGEVVIETLPYGMLMFDSRCRLSYVLHDRTIVVMTNIRALIDTDGMLIGASIGWVEDGNKVIHIQSEILADIIGSVITERFKDEQERMAKQKK